MSQATWPLKFCVSLPINKGSDMIMRNVVSGMNMRLCEKWIAAGLAILAAFVVAVLVAAPAWAQNKVPVDGGKGQDGATSSPQTTNPAQKAVNFTNSESAGELQDTAGRTDTTSASSTSPAALQESTVSQQGDKQQSGVGEDASDQSSSRSQGTAGSPYWSFGAQMRQAERPQQSAQPQEDGSIVGKPVIPQEWNRKRVTRATIDANGCTVQQGATITVADEDGTQGLLEDGNGSEITANGEQIVITGPGGKGPIEFADISGGSDDQIKGPVTVTDSTGISCPGEGNGPIALPGCKNPLQLLKIVDNKSTRTDPFFVSAPSFSVLVKTSPKSAGSGSTTVSVFKRRYSGDNAGKKVATRTFEGGKDGIVKVNSGPGAYLLEIKTQNQSYRIAAEQCGGVPSMSAIPAHL